MIWCSICQTLPLGITLWRGSPSAGVRPVAQIDYWEDNGGVTFEDPDGRKVVFVSWIYGQ